ncbi:MAG: hypothetical protein EBR34_16090 [Sphingomonadaceae bacterium]|nr:hypothetical protein [Sphingomonadaceae bacterium]
MILVQMQCSDNDEIVWIISRFAAIKVDVISKFLLIRIKFLKVFLDKEILTVLPLNPIDHDLVLMDAGYQRNW